MRRIIFSILVIMISSFVYGQKYVVDTSIGDVYVLNKGKSSIVEVGYIIKQGDTIKTGRDSECYISVDRRGYIKVEPNTSVKFEEIESIAKESKRDKLSVNGNIILSVKGIFSQNSSLSIKTSTAFATVRGTEFVIEVADMTTRVYVLEGKVEVAPLVSQVESDLLMFSTLLNAGEKIEISEIDVINATSFLRKGKEGEYGVFLNSKKKSIIASERERFSQRMKMLRDLQKKRKEELERKKKEYLKDPSKMFEE
ncbi:MAG: FecR family protein [Brevinematales bacterium]|nr:FecR family protein [Brevinematales bacterium]